ncbi:S8 family serine peptidase [Actinomadura parmotrematis]|uniref:S8 family serine peptidase n=1 Tax=Actinomadura parmotrematis TaxID=2864039 RepID=A0ABS7G385_9ACTN|nr:S8 family serine peptidase [Actinomadura parmotrematis]MBW8487177.1 S8 family serine peptidase [Actinomadura parmotrematis]
MALSSGRSPRGRRALAGLAAAALAAGAAQLAPAAAQAAPSPDAAAPARVIVLLKDASARSAVVAKVRKAGGTDVTAFQAVPSFSATVPAAEAAALAADASVASVLPDSTVTVEPPAPSQAASAAPKAAVAGKAAGTVPSNVCPSDPGKPLLEPEALATTHALQAQRAGVTGKGVTVAYIADGVDPNNPDFVRPDGSKVFKDYRDFSAEGPDTPSGGAEAFGDASAIAAQGRQVYDLSKFVNPTNPLPAGCNIRVLGMAPGASIVGLKAGGELLPNSSILQSIDYAISRHVDVLNESFGSNAYPDDGTRDTIQRFNDAAVRAGITVTVSTGDAGITGTQGTPSTDPNVIAVAATTDSQIYQQTGYAMARYAKPGKWADSNISALSSGGISQAGRTPDLAAPGEADWALCSTDAEKFTGCTGYAGTPQPIQAFGGTSQSAPLTAGAAALVIEAYRTAHHGASPSPALVKRFLTGTARDLGMPGPEQGAGLLDAQAAVAAAKAYQGADPGRILAPAQTTLTGAPGATVTAPLKVTNSGGRTATVRAGTRDYATTGTSRRTVALDPSSLPTFPYATNGAPWVYRKVTFRVGKGADVLGVSTAWTGSNVVHDDGSEIGPVVRLTLIDPRGTFQTNSRPQGGAYTANHAYVDVRKPAAGTWTALLYTPQSGAQSYTGPVILQSTTQKAVPRGTVSPSSLTLKPGQTGTFTLRTKVDGTSGDRARQVTFTGTGGQAVSTPVVVRPVVPVAHGRGTFSGTVTGGNARAYAPAQTATYAFDVPAGLHDVGVTLKLAKDPGVLVEAALVDPDGELIGTGSNARGFDDDYQPITGATLQVTQAEPVAGRWRLTVIVANPVSGKEISQGFAGTIGFDQVKVSGALPAGGTRLPAGRAASYTLTYGNNGVAPVPVQTDARLDGYTDVALAPLGTSPTFALPLTPESSVPFYLVPPGTAALSVAARSSLPAQVELQGPAGSPDVFGDLASAKAGATTSVARISEAGGRHVLARGFYGTFVQEIGPFAGPGPAGTTTLSALARTRPFDGHASSPAGDPYTVAVTGDFTPNGTPVVVAPGGSGKVTVTFTPSGAPGTVVTGTLYLVTSPVANYDGTKGAIQTGGDVLAALPYSYTVG